MCRDMKWPHIGHALTPVQYNAIGVRVCLVQGHMVSLVYVSFGPRWMCLVPLKTAIESMLMVGIMLQIICEEHFQLYTFLIAHKKVV